VKLSASGQRDVFELGSRELLAGAASDVHSLMYTTVLVERRGWFFDARRLEFDAFRVRKQLSLICTILCIAKTARKQKNNTNQKR
jgi:hypothetical protein